MAKPRIVQIAEAVVAELNGHDFTEPFDAVRAYQPTYDLKDMKDLKVTVVPKARTSLLVSRQDDRLDYTVDIGIQKKMPDDDAGDVLMALVREISDFLKRRPLAAVPDVSWVQTTNDPIFSPDHLEQLRQFTSVLSVTYRGIE